MEKLPITGSSLNGSSLTHNNRYRNKSSSNKLLTAVFNVILLSISLLLLYNALASIAITKEKLVIFDKAEKEVDNMRLENIGKVLEKEQIQSDRYLEAEARDRLSYGRDGEVFFVIDENVLKSVDLNKYVESESSSAQSLKPAQVLQVWQKYLFD